MDRRDCLQIALALLKRYRLVGWNFGFHLNPRPGNCDHTKQKISLWDKLVDRSDDPATVREVILHEIAHALVGAGHGHDEVWQAKALQIGASGKQYFVGSNPEEPSDPEIAYLEWRSTQEEWDT